MARRLLLLSGAGVALAMAALGCATEPHWPQVWPLIDSGMAAATRTLDHLGLVGFLLLQVLIAISGFVPASLVGISAGAAYGVTLGFLTASISTLTGALVAFLVSRSLLRPFVERKLRKRPHLASLDGDIGNRGWRLVCLLRLSPVMPFAATSYALGLSSMALGDYLAGTLASLPSLFGYVLAGALVKTGLSSWGDGAHLIRLASLGVGTLSMILLMAQIGGMVRRATSAREGRAAIVERTHFRGLGAWFAALWCRSRGYLVPPTKTTYAVAPVGARSGKHV